jgi:hypothetical protein
VQANRPSHNAARGLGAQYRLFTTQHTLLIAVVVVPAVRMLDGVPTTSLLAGLRDSMVCHRLLVIIATMLAATAAGLEMKAQDCELRTIRIDRH